MNPICKDCNKSSVEHTFNTFKYYYCEECKKEVINDEGDDNDMLKEFERLLRLLGWTYLYELNDFHYIERDDGQREFISSIEVPEFIKHIKYNIVGLS